MGHWRRGRGPTVATELGLGTQLMSTMRAGVDELGAAFLAELGTFTILMLTLGTLHYRPPPDHLTPWPWGIQAAL